MPRYISFLSESLEVTFLLIHKILSWLSNLQTTQSSLQYNMWLWLAFLILWQTFKNSLYFLLLFYYSVLVFPPVNNYRRFLIHKVCETVSNDKQNSITTFSIGQNLQRRTVVCQRHQLLIDPKSVALKRWLNWINGF